MVWRKIPFFLFDSQHYRALSICTLNLSVLFFFLPSFFSSKNAYTNFNIIRRKEKILVSFAGALFFDIIRYRSKPAQLFWSFTYFRSSLFYKLIVILIITICLTYLFQYDRDRNFSANEFNLILFGIPTKGSALSTLRLIV